MCEIQQVQLASRKHRHKPQHLLLPYSSRDPLGTGECQQQAGTWHPVPAGHLPACAAQSGEPRASSPPCLVPARLWLWASSALVLLRSPPLSKAGGPGQMPPGQLPQQSCASRLPQPLSCYLHLFWQAVPGRKQLTPVSCGNVSFNGCTSLHGCLRDHTYPTLSSLLCTCGHGEGWKSSGPSVAGTHTEIPGCPWQRDRTNGVHTQ